MWRCCKENNTNSTPLYTIMIIKKEIVTVQGAKSAELALEGEVKKVFNGSLFKCYCAVGELAKIAKKVQGKFLGKEQINALIEKHQHDIEARRHFSEDGIDFFIRVRRDYTFGPDEELDGLLLTLKSAQDAVENRKKQLIEESKASYVEKHILECHGEAKE